MIDKSVSPPTINFFYQDHFLKSNKSTNINTVLCLLDFSGSELPIFCHPDSNIEMTPIAASVHCSVFTVYFKICKPLCYLFLSYFS